MPTAAADTQRRHVLKSGNRDSSFQPFRLASSGKNFLKNFTGRNCTIKAWLAAALEEGTYECP